MSRSERQITTSNCAATRCITVTASADLPMPPMPTSIGVDPSRLAVAGEGVGGNLATVTTLLAKERGGPQIDFQVLLYPVTDANLETQSYQAFETDNYWITHETMRWFWDSDVPAAERHEFTVSPLQASLEQLRGLPPALIITNECDIVRDEGEPMPIT